VPFAKEVPAEGDARAKRVPEGESGIVEWGGDGMEDAASCALGWAER
jgi:hypothetical protein